MKYRFLLGLFLCSIIFSCSEDNRVYFLAKNKSYYPIETGYFNQYNVTEINIDKPSEIFDTTRYQLKELIGGTFTDNQGIPTNILMRYKRTDSLQKWEIKDIWAVQDYDNRITLNEENLKYVKLIFPCQQGNTWDGNAYNINDKQIYEISEINTPGTINQHSFDSCLTVLQQADSSLIHKDFAVEQFANNTGLIYKEITHINSQEIEPGIPLNQRVTTGTIYIQEFVKREKDENYEN